MRSLFAVAVALATALGAWATWSAREAASPSPSILEQMLNEHTLVSPLNGPSL
jgi:hypothetical protein